MTWDSVPWFVGGGAEHSPEVARLLAFAATSGSQGIISPPDLKVVPLAVPGAGVRVLPGAALVLSRSGDRQTYVARLPSADTAAVAATGSSGTRVDLVAVRIEDPFAPGTPWQAPADPKVGPYVRTVVLPNVPASAVVDSHAAAAYLAGQGFSALPLAAVTLPPSTGTVNAGHIKDLRVMANPRRHRVSVTSGAPGTEALTATSNARWITPAQWDIRIPEWASTMFVRADVLNAILLSGNVYGTVGVAIDSAEYVATSAYAATFPNASVRTNLLAANQFDHVAEVYRGTVRTFALYGRRDATTGHLTTDAQTRVVLDIEFSERPV